MLEEQSADVEQIAGSGVDARELAARYPTLTAAIRDYVVDGATLDDLYRDSVRLILGAAE